MPVRRVVLIVMDGLRPDAIPRFDLRACRRLARRGASTSLARTVEPSLTATCMASLLTGAAPERHGLQGGRFYLPRPRGETHPLPRVLAAHSLPSSAYIARVPMLMVGIAHRIGSHLGFTRTRFEGHGAADISRAAIRELAQPWRGLMVMHWPDADRAGHAAGWMSDPYARAAETMDAALGQVMDVLDLDDPETLLVVMADHGGGGAVPDHHDSAHPLDRTIPILMAGGQVRPGEIPQGASLLDVPATILWAMGIPRPSSYAGTPLTTAFRTPTPLVVAA
ncbi:MAG: alkaline phosphatase [Gemmatimonadetes bacterium]|nr:alkaline phosphatase [Gemmatimonadota bacterium]